MIVPPFKKSYSGRTVLNTPALELLEGRIYALVGANGSGKSTFSKMLAGIERSDDGADFHGHPVGYMPQKSYAFRMSTKKNVMLGGSNADKCAVLMRALNISQLAEEPAKSLSGGESARMALCRLMMRDYSLAILDEPTASMDMQSTLLAEELMQEYRRTSGCALLLVTHSLQQAKRVADDILFLDGGELVEMGGKADFFQNPKDERSQRFLRFYGL